MPTIVVSEDTDAVDVEQSGMHQPVTPLGWRAEDNIPSAPTVDLDTLFWDRVGSRNFMQAEGLLQRLPAALRIIA